jgi:DNA-binding NtrC family response regulator
MALNNEDIMTPGFRILIVDDEPEIVKLYEELLTQEGYEITTAYSGAEGLRYVREDLFDMVITDIRMPDVTGLDILNEVRKLHPDTLVLLITAFGTIEAAIKAMKEGAYDYISKPARNDEIRLIVKRGLEQRQLQKNYQNLQKGLKDKYRLENIVGRSNEMLEVYKTVAKISQSRATVLITGESGTGKELVARAIHQNSPRAERPFVVIHCASLPETLIESELFGYMKGSFTGAMSSKKGLFEEADTGTVFLDEIGDVPLATQVKLLRVLQEKEIRRIGAEQPIKVDVRIIAATNRNLEDMIQKSQFREDLYYRLSVVSIQLPPLRSRRDDINLLVQHFLRKYCQEAGVPLKIISPDAMHLMESYNWPGNVRELENVIERAVNLSFRDGITVDDLPQKLIEKKVISQPSLMEQTPTLEELEKNYLIKLLNENDWNYTETAEKMGISVRTVQRMVSRFHLEKR